MSQFFKIEPTASEDLMNVYLEQRSIMIELMILEKEEEVHITPIFFEYLSKTNNILIYKETFNQLY